MSYSPVPYPVPTPYQKPSQGGNPYVTPGTVGIAVPPTIQPVYGPQQKGLTEWTNGMITSSGGGTLYKSPQSSRNVAGATTQVAPIVSTQPQSQGGGGSGGGDSRLQQLEKTNRNPVQETEYQNLLAQLNQQNTNAIEAARQRQIEDNNRAIEAARQRQIEDNNRVLDSLLQYVGGARGRAGEMWESGKQGVQGFRDRAKSAWDSAQKQILDRFTNTDQDIVEKSSQSLGEGARTFDDLYNRSANVLNKMGLSTMLSGLDRLRESYGRQQGQVVNQRDSNQRENFTNRTANEESNQSLLNQRMDEAQAEETAKRLAYEDIMAQLESQEQGARANRDSADANVGAWANTMLGNQQAMNQMISQMALDSLLNRSTNAYNAQAYNPVWELQNMMNANVPQAVSTQQVDAGGVNPYNPTTQNELLKRRGLYA